MGYTHHLTTDQLSRDVGRPDQVQNDAGGFVFEVTPLSQLRRFLITGTTDNQLRIGRSGTTRNLENLARVVRAQGVKAVDLIVEVSDGGLARSNDEAIFALAFAARNGDEATKRAAYAAMPKVVRTGMHLFQWADVMKSLGSTLGSRGARKAISNWYLGKSPRNLSLQLTKYRSRKGGESGRGWTHRDVLRLAHVRPALAGDSPITTMLAWAANHENVQPASMTDDLGLILMYERLQRATSEFEVVKIIKETNPPWELVDTQWLGSKKVWEALFPSLPLTALIRNLGRLSHHGILSRGSPNNTDAVRRLTDVEAIKGARVHPLSALIAQRTYRQGRGEKGKLFWNAATSVVDALEETFYASFQTIEPTGKSFMLALDVSGSMTAPVVAGFDQKGHPKYLPIDCREASAVMAMVTARSEPEYAIVGFTSSGSYGYNWRENSELTDIDVSKRDSLSTVVDRISRLRMGGTDCALPFVVAQREKWAIDCFVVYTDSETWAGRVKPHQALKDYRAAMGRPARSVIVGMEANPFTIADPRDAGMLDVVGFDASAPATISNFAAGRV